MMNERVRKTLDEVNSGERNEIFDLSFTLEEYLSKDIDGITFLEHLLDKKVYILDDSIKTSIEAAMIYLKKDKGLFSFEFNDEQLFSKIGDQRFIDIIVDKKVLYPNLIKNIKNNIEIVDILISNNEYYYLNFISAEIIEKLMKKNKDNEYPIEKYINNEKIITKLIPLINNASNLIDVCQKYNKEYLLKGANEETLMVQIDNNMSLLDHLLNKNIIPEKLDNIPDNLKFINFLRMKNLYNYLKKAGIDVLLKEVCVSGTNKTLLEELIEMNCIDAITHKIFKSNKEIIMILYKNNRLDLICNIDFSLLSSKAKDIINDGSIASDETLLEYMLSKGYNPISQADFAFTDEKLLIKLSEDVLLIDKLLDYNILSNFVRTNFNSEIIAKKLYERNRLDLLIRGNLSLLLKKIDDKKTYMDYILEGIKSKTLKCSLNDVNTSVVPVNDIARFYLMIAEHDMMEYINVLSEEELLEEHNGNTLLNELLSLNEEITVNKILSKKVLSNIKIAIILRARNIELKNIDIPLEKKDLTGNYLTGIENRHGIGPLLNEGEILLKELQELFNSDGKSAPKLISSLVSGYRQALFENYEDNIYELRTLIEVKKNNFNKFIYIKEENGAYFNHSTGSIHCNGNVVSTILHETGHALHSYLAKSRIPEDYTRIKESLMNDPKILKKIEKFANKYREIYDKVTIVAQRKYENFMDEYITSEKIVEISKFLKKTKVEKKEEFKTLGFSDEVLEILLNKIFSGREYFEQQKRIFIKKYTDDIIRSEFGNITAIGDILDAIYDGELFSGVLKNEKGEKIKRTSGHGIAYYSNTSHGFDEIVANFSQIMKEYNSKETLEILKNILGEEFYNMLSTFYYNNILRCDYTQNKNNIK